MASVTTRDHDEIMAWAQDHGATPAVVSRTGGMLRFEFAAPSGAEAGGELAPVAWDDFFQVFDDKGLELVFDDKPGSRFHKLIYPETAAARKAGTRRAARPARSRIRERIAPAARSRKPGASRSSRTTSAKPAARAKAKPVSQASRKSKPATAKSAAAFRTTTKAKASRSRSRTRKAA